MMVRRISFIYRYQLVYTFYDYFIPFKTREYNIERRFFSAFFTVTRYD